MNRIGFNEFGDLRGGDRPLWEHRPRCDEGGGLRGLIAAGAALLQGGVQRGLGDGGGVCGALSLSPVGAPPSVR